ncbi:hypothetical protein [Pseudolysinimonas sp.]|uniref:hypothetical protein n=1 Tax=Pseudolysinimonas sp. TaxID=2680009 RepID=UPI00286D3263|nr:hypothetical protein [Pseudolysinimonas sp.]
MTRRRRLAILGASAVFALVVVPVGGIALAYWGGTGGGTGTSATGDVVPVSLSGGTPPANLRPGATAHVVLTATNTNDSPVRIDSLSLDTASGTGGFAVDAGHSGCSVAVLSFTTQNNGGSGWTIPARVGVVNGTLGITLPNAIGMSTSAANACQGATFTVYLVSG